MARKASAGDESPVKDQLSIFGVWVFAMARWLAVAGITLLIIAAIVQFAPWAISWFGKLPGDINIDKGNTKVFIPITSMLVVSVLLSILVSIFNR